jgi:hypothetical protein
MPISLAIDHIYVRYSVPSNLIAKKYIFLCGGALLAAGYFSHSVSTAIRSAIHNRKIDAWSRKSSGPLPIRLAVFAALCPQFGQVTPIQSDDFAGRASSGASA